MSPIAKMFSFELSDWQKRALDAIERGDHCLVTAPTGSGKTVPAECAIKKANLDGKKVIYTSPIKALSNQKYYEFQEKFPDTSFGILTGDIKDNPEADVLIMTTEILCNHLHNLKHPDSKLEFNIDFQTELGFVVFDEVHYINDADRGTVWEECFMLLPSHIQLVMLSATIATPDKFAKWIESIHPSSGKCVELCETEIRAVPLKHFMWLTAVDSVFKNCKIRDMNSLMEKVCNKPIDLYSSQEGFNERGFRDVSKARYYLQTNHFIKRQHVLNQVIRYLKANTMLPAICFVYSRKNVEKFALEISLNLNDSTKMNKVAQECRGILSKFPNAKEFMSLPEYEMIVGLLEKGIGIHHSGLLPVFREMVELMFERGYVQMLFATETFAVGLNMPTKTVLFTAIKKHDGNGLRFLLPHEYTQQAGRAGRRGYDKVGHVIHLSNLFEQPTSEEYRTLLGNVPQKIVSKFKISYSLLLNSENPAAFIEKSAIQSDIQNEMTYSKREKERTEREIETLEDSVTSHFRTKRDVLERIYELQENMHLYKNKSRKAKERELEGLLDENPKAKEEVKSIGVLKAKRDELSEWTNRLENTENYVKYQVDAVFDILQNNDFRGLRAEIARGIKETHPLMMTDCFGKFGYCDPIELSAFFSCFTNVNVDDAVKNQRPSCKAVRVLQMMEIAEERLNHYYNEEVRTNIFSGACYDIHYDLGDEIVKWCECDTEEKCQSFLNDLRNEKGIFLGEFTKAVLKINAIAKEMEKIAEIGGLTDIQFNLSEIGRLTLKSVCTSQSLYV